MRKVHTLVLGVPNNRLTCMHGQKTLSLSYKNIIIIIICIYFLSYLLSDSQTIRSMIHFSKPLLCVMLICSDWSDWFYFHFILPVMVIAHEVWNFRMRLSYSSSFPIKMLATDAKTQKNQTDFFYDRRKFQRQSVNVNDTVWGRIYFSTCKYFGQNFSQCAMALMPDKAVFVSALLLYVQRYRGNSYFTSKSGT